MIRLKTEEKKKQKLKNSDAKEGLLFLVKWRQSGKANNLPYSIQT